MTDFDAIFLFDIEFSGRVTPISQFLGVDSYNLEPLFFQKYFNVRLTSFLRNKEY